MRNFQRRQTSYFLDRNERSAVSRGSSDTGWSRDSQRIISGSIAPPMLWLCTPISPLRCLAFLSAVAGVSIFIARLPALTPDPLLHLRARNLPAAYIGMLLVFLSVYSRHTAGMAAPCSGHPMPWRSRLRRGIFLALKIALVQPMMLCGLFLQIVMGPLGGFLGPVFNVASILVLRWVITDQQQRCPVCLRLLTAPIRIGSASRTFLEWYGAESTCSRGHGLLHVSESEFSFSRRPQWLSLDDSWKDLFAGRQT